MQEYHVISYDRNCSIETKPGTFYLTNVIWIDKVKEFAPVTDGFHLSPVYQIQPFDLALISKFRGGIRYDRDLVEHSNLGIYYYDG